MKSQWDDPRPDHAGPDHVSDESFEMMMPNQPQIDTMLRMLAMLFGDVPRPDIDPQVLDHAALPQASGKLNSILEVRRRPGDVHGQDEQWKHSAQCQVQVVGRVVRAAPSR